MNNRFDSPTRSLHVSAGQDIFIKSGAGSIDASCLNDVRLHSEAGNVSDSTKCMYNGNSTSSDN